MPLTPIAANLITGAGKFDQFDDHRLKRILITGVSNSNSVHCSGVNYHLNFSGWRTLAASANTVLLGATPRQCLLGLINTYLINGNLVTSPAPPTDTQMKVILNEADLLQAMPDTELDKMLLYLYGIQAQTISDL